MQWHLKGWWDGRLKWVVEGILNRILNRCVNLNNRRRRLYRSILDCNLNWNWNRVRHCQRDGSRRR